MMPEGLLKALSDEEVSYLISYLHTTSQVPLPKNRKRWLIYRKDLPP